MTAVEEAVIRLSTACWDYGSGVAVAVTSRWVSGSTIGEFDVCK